MNAIINEMKVNHGDRDMCRNHSAKADRDVLRHCPSKLSKRDLEDLYFAMLDNNLELKQRINTLQENNKMLNTKVHRMTAAQKTFIGKEKDCCSSMKAMVQEQRESIADLKKANERMTERIRVLSMRLCSAKQFLRRSPSQTTARSLKLLMAPPTSLKNSSVSMLNTKDSSAKVMAAIQYITPEKEGISTRTAVTENSDLEKENSVRECNDNKCRTIMEELRQNTIGLEEELANCHEEYLSRISRLESEMATLQSGKQVALAASSHGLQQRTQKMEMLAAKLRAATVYGNELKAQLLIEKSKVAELETTLRAVEISNQLAKNIENRLSIGDEEKSPPMGKSTPIPDLSSSYPRDWDESSPRLEVPRTAPRCRRSPTSVASFEDVGISKHSDDSGYTDTAKSAEVDNEKVLAKVNEDLMKKIIHLQKQLDELKVSNRNKKNNDPSLTNVANPTPVQKVGEPDCAESIRSDCSNQEFQKNDCKLITSKAASLRSDGSNHQKHHSERKMQEVNETNKLSESYDAAVEKKILDGKETQPKPEEQIHFTTDKTEPQHMTSEERTTKIDDQNSQHISGRLPVDISADKSKEKSFKSAYEKVKNVGKLRQAKPSQDKKLPFEDKIDQRKLQNRPIELKDDKPIGILNDDCVDDNFKFENIDKNTAKEIPTRNKHTSDNLCFPSHYYKNYADASFVKKEKKKLKRELSRVQSDEHVKRGEEHEVRPLEVETCDVPLTSRSIASGCLTYTIDRGATSRATTPDNTDQEISSITDLPSEGNVTSPRAMLSPGEEKATSTYSETYTETYTENGNHASEAGSLSEGELPARYTGRKSSGEYKGRVAVTTTQTKPVPVAQKMEAALQSIGEELARCRELLASQRPLEVIHWPSM